MSQILHAIIKGIWAIDPEGALAFLPEVKRVLEGKSFPLTGEELKAYRAEHLPAYMNASGAMITCGDDGTVGPEAEPEQEKYVMVMPVRGAILRNDVSCGPYGMETRAKWLRTAQADPRVVGVVLDMDTPGGQGSGMDVFVKQLQRMTKPVVTFVNSGVSASAGYGIAAATREIILSGKTDVVGSIGALMTLADWKTHFEKHLDLPIHEVYASQSTEKNRPFLLALKANSNDPNDPHYKELREKVLDPFTQDFIDHVKASRPGVKDKSGVFAGAIFYGDEAIALGLADGYGTLETAVERVRAMAKTDNKNKGAGTGAGASTSTTTTTTMSFKSAITAAVAGFVTLFSKNEDITTESLAAANAELKEKGLEGVVLVSSARLLEMEGAEAAATAKVTEANTAVQAAEQKVTDLTAQLEEAKATIAKLEETPSTDGKPAGAPNTTGGDKNLGGGTELSEEEKAFQAATLADLKQQ